MGFFFRKRGEEKIENGTEATEKDEDKEIDAKEEPQNILYDTADF